MIRRQSFARAGWLGNPSDGFGGKTISFSIGQFAAEVCLEPSEQLEIIPAADDQNQFASMQDLVSRVEQQGYYGAERLIKAAIKRFYEYFDGQGKSEILRKNFKITYQSNIPRSVGLAGSSAIIVATLRGLESFYDVKVTPAVLPSLALSVEVDELGIPAGLQDRVIQCYQGLVYMDFDEQQAKLEQGMKVGIYSGIDRPILFDQLYISFGDEAGQPTEVLHNDLRQRFDQGDPDVVTAMRQFAELARQGRVAIANEDVEALHQLINANFDLRRSICRLHPAHIQMIESARQCGASAKYCGSGGAIVGLCSDESYPKLRESMANMGCQTIRPEFVEPIESGQDANIL